MLFSRGFLLFHSLALYPKNGAGGAKNRLLRGFAAFSLLHKKARMPCMRAFGLALGDSPPFETAGVPWESNDYTKCNI